MKKALVIHPSDNVAVALDDLQKGDEITVSSEGKPVTVHVKDDIQFAHKIAIKDIMKSEAVVKFGGCLGIATEDIKMGEHVHIHNLKGVRG